MVGVCTRKVNILQGKWAGLSIMNSHSYFFARFAAWLALLTSGMSQDGSDAAIDPPDRRLQDTTKSNIVPRLPSR